MLIIQQEKFGAGLKTARAAAFCILMGIDQAFRCTFLRDLKAILQRDLERVDQRSVNSIRYGAMVVSRLKRFAMSASTENRPAPKMSTISDAKRKV